MIGGKHCPAPGCGEMIDQEVIACRSHWSALPEDLREAITEAWKRRQDSDIEAVIEYGDRLGQAINLWRITT
jgi:hypothetical protein